MTAREMEAYLAGEDLPDRDPTAPAFSPDDYEERALLDTFAAAALGALLPCVSHHRRAELAAQCWDVAEAMIAERRRRRSAQPEGTP